MQLFSLKGVTGLPDNFPIQQSWVVFADKIKMNALQKQLIFLLNGEVIWQASGDSPLSKDLHAIVIALTSRRR